MKKLLLGLLTVLMLVVCAFSMIACDGNTNGGNNSGNNNQTNNQPNNPNDGNGGNQSGNTPNNPSDNQSNNPTQTLTGTQIKIADFELVEDVYKLTVSNATEEYDFNNSITVAKGSQYYVSRDKYGENTILTKVASLSVGDNTLYVIVFDSAENSQAYKVVVRRKPMYIVTFDGAGVESQQIEEGYTAVMPTVTPTKTGYTYVEWDFDFTQPIVGTTQVNAKWQANEYTVSFDGNGVENPVDKQVTYDSTYGELPTLTRTGYTFDGWYTSFNGWEKVTDTTAVTTASAHTLYARWSAIRYSITFNSGTGYTITANKNGNNFYSGNTITIEDSITFTVTPSLGYTAGELTASGTKRTFENNVLSGVYENITISSSATANTYTVYFDGNGVENPANKQVTFDSTYGELPTLTRTGYTFNGWYTSLSGGTKIIDTTTVATASEHTLYAGWRTDVMYGEINNGTEYAVVGYNNSKTDIVILDEYNGKPVTSIGEYAFEHCWGLESVYYTGTIDQWVSIDFVSYSYSAPLIYGADSFSNPLIYGADLYINNEKVTEVNITTATEIKDYAFYGYESLESVTIGDSVTSIGSGAFENCSSLTSVTFENTDGWSADRRYDFWLDGMADHFAISSTDLNDDKKAAEYLSCTYGYYHWTRTA